MDAANHTDGASIQSLAHVQGRSAWVDLSDPESNRELKNAKQDALRDKFQRQNAAYISEDPDVRTVYIECSDNGDCDQVGLDASKDASRVRLEKISKEVEEIALAANLQTSLKTNPIAQLQLLGAISGTSQTWSAPMLAIHKDEYWQSTSWPYEKQLIAQLNQKEKQISQADLLRTTLKICNNDTQLALLTLANFSKNIASIERRQIREDTIEPGLAESYKKKNVDSLFHRIEGLADDPDQKYNKEGALYHFWGAMLAGAKWGVVTQGLVAYDNWALGMGNETRRRTDSIKDNAGSMGAKVGNSVWLNSFIPSIFRESKSPK